MVNVHRVDDLMLDLYDVQYLYFVVTGLGIIKNEFPEVCYDNCCGNRTTMKCQSQI